MKTKYLMMMLIWTLCLITVCSCYPTKPLNERSTELAWEAWLLVDQSRQGDLGLLRRRITPKSVFIAPTFSPDTLPACADGYKSDSMGRCVKIIKINESIHFDFLLQQLNEQFADYEDTAEDAAAEEPLQLNIPLVEKFEENETDFAIIVTPARTKHYEKTSAKIDGKRKGDDNFNVENIAAILGVKPEDVEMTTIAQLTTTTQTDTTTTNQPTTIMDLDTTFPTETGDDNSEMTTNAETTTGIMENDELMDSTQETTTTDIIPTTTDDTPTEANILLRWRF